MKSNICPECDANLEIPGDAVAGEIVACQDCGQSYELSGADDDLKLKVAETVGEDWGQ